MDEKKQEAFVQFLVEALGLETQEEIEEALSKLSKEQIQELIAAFEEYYKNKGGEAEESETPMARFGMKICPKGQKIVSFKMGGKTCRVCVGKKKTPAERFKLIKKNK